MKRTQTFEYRAQSERITGISGLTQANRYVILNPAVGILATGTDARIATLLRDASLIRRTVRVNYAFRAAIWRYSYVILQASAGGLIVDNFALRVESARTGEARIHRWHRHNCKKKTARRTNCTNAP